MEVPARKNLRGKGKVLLRTNPTGLPGTERGEIGMMYRRDAKNRSLDDFGEAKPKMSIKGRRPERAPLPPSGPLALAAASALK